MIFILLVVLVATKSKAMNSISALAIVFITVSEDGLVEIQMIFILLVVTCFTNCCNEVFHN